MSTFCRRLGVKCWKMNKGHLVKPSFVKGQFFLSQIKRKTEDEWGCGGVGCNGSKWCRWRWMILVWVISTAVSVGEGNPLRRLPHNSSTAIHTFWCNFHPHKHSLSCATIISALPRKRLLRRPHQLLVCGAEWKWVWELIIWPQPSFWEVFSAAGNGLGIGDGVGRPSHISGSSIWSCLTIDLTRFDHQHWPCDQCLTDNFNVWQYQSLKATIKLTTLVQTHLYCMTDLAQTLSPPIFLVFLDPQPLWTWALT